MCTSLQIKAGDGGIVAGRTMEFAVDVASHLMVVPAGSETVGTLPGGSEGMRWRSRYGMVGATALGLPVIVDGINERGLYVGDLYFPGFAGCAEVTPASAPRAMASYQFGHWLLGRFAAVDEVRGAVGDVVLADTPVPALGGAPPLHFIVRDRSGASLVVEPIGGRLVVSDDPVGVLTNAPPFDWHLINLRNYVGLDPHNRPGRQLGAHLVEPLEFGNGTGMFGLPGDASPPSRFVRAVAYSQTAMPAADARAAVLQMFHMMNSFDIPPGSVRDGEGKSTHVDRTEWTSVADLANACWYFRTYEDQTIRKVDLRSALAACRGAVATAPMRSEQAIVDVSASFGPRVGPGA